MTVISEFAEIVGIIYLNRNLQHTHPQIFLYSHFNIEENPNKIKAMVGEPELINVGWFENISKILRNLGCRLGIQKYNENSNRQWLFSESNGTICHTAMKIIMFLHCGCNISVYRKEIFSEHTSAELRDAIPTHEFD